MAPSCVQGEPSRRFMINPGRGRKSEQQLTAGLSRPCVDVTSFHHLIEEVGDVGRMRGHFDKDVDRPEEQPRLEV